MYTTTKMPFQVWILTLAAFAIGTAEFVNLLALGSASKRLSILADSTTP